jgi:two-component system C4-dicarboxylate transport response regulator DctD
MTTSIGGKSILVVDDEEAMLRALRKVLTGEGALVTSTCKPLEAAAHLTTSLERFDLIITDLRMPVLEGQNILGAVGVAIPVIIITAFGNPEIRAQCLKVGAAAFLEKPLDAPHLIAVIAQVLGTTRHSAREARIRGALKQTPPSESEPVSGLADFLRESTPESPS